MISLRPPSSRLWAGGSTRLWIGGVILILLAAFSFRLWHLGTQSLWHDEAWSVFSAYQPTAPMGIRGSDPNAPPLFYSSLHVWLKLVGDEVWTMRFWSLLIGVIGVALGGAITRRWFGTQAGLIAAFLLAFNPILWVFSQEIRAYIVMPLWALFLLNLSEPFTQPRAVRIALRSWAWLLAVELIALYTHNLSVPLVAWLNVSVGAALLLRRAWRRALWWGIGQTVLLIGYLPWLLTQSQTGTALNTPPALNLSLIGAIWESFFTGIKAMVQADPILSLLATIFGLVTLTVTINVLRQRQSPRLWLVISQAVLLPLFQLAIIRAAHIDFHPRYFILGVPALLILVGVGTSVPISTLIVNKRSLHPIIKRERSGYSQFPVLTLATVVIALAITLRMVTLLYSSPIYQHDDFRSIARRYASLPPESALIIPYGWEPSLDYYRQKLNFKASLVEVPVYSPPEVIITTLLQGLKGKTQAELLTWFQLPADVRGAYPCLLGTVGAKVGELTVSGVRTESYQIDPVRLGSIRLEALLFEESGSSAETTLPEVRHQAQAWIGNCLILVWQASTMPTADWRISLRAYGEAGAEVQLNDSDILSDQQIPTSQWTKGTQGATFSLIPKQETPAMLRLILYRRTDFSEGGRLELGAIP